MTTKKKKDETLTEPTPPADANAPAREAAAEAARAAEGPSETFEPKDSSAGEKAAREPRFVPKDETPAEARETRALIEETGDNSARPEMSTTSDSTDEISPETSMRMMPGPQAVLMAGGPMPKSEEPISLEDALKAADAALKTALEAAAREPSAIENVRLLGASHARLSEFAESIGKKL